jgi:transposase
MNHYDKEYKEKTALLIIEGMKSASQLARELNINKNTVCKWVIEYRQTHGVKMPEKSVKAISHHEDRIKIREMEKQIREQEEEIEILKKAMAIFSSKRR